MGTLNFTKPIGTTGINSTYGMRTHPITGLQKFHYGIDYTANTEGIEIKASEDGKVIRAAHGTVTGETIIIDHTPKAKDSERHIYTMYAHLRFGNAYNVSVNDRVEQGNFVGYSGDSGSSSGPHLHFSVIDSESKVAWNTGTGGTGVNPSENTFFKNPTDYIGVDCEVGGTIYDLSEEEHKKVTESLDVKMHLDFPNHSWYGDVYLDKKR